MNDPMCTGTDITLKVFQKMTFYHYTLYVGTFCENGLFCYSLCDCETSALIDSS